MLSVLKNDPTTSCSGSGSAKLPLDEKLSVLFKSVFKPALRAAVSVSPVLAGGSAADAGDGVGASSSKWQEAAESIADTESILTLLMEALGTTAKDKQQPAAGSGGEEEEEGDTAASFRARVEGMLALKGSTWHAKQGPPQQGQEQGQEQPQREEKLLTDLITVLVMSVTALDVYSEGDFSKALMQTLLLNFLRQAQEEEEEEEEEGEEES